MRSLVFIVMRIQDSFADSNGCSCRNQVLHLNTSLQYILATHLLLVDQQMRPTYGHVHAYIHTYNNANGCNCR